MGWNSVTVQLTDPSHGGAYMAEGHLLLSSDWLIVDPEPCSFMHHHALYQYIVSVVCSPPRTLEGGLIVAICYYDMVCVL